MKNSSGIPQVAPKASTTVAPRFSASAFTGELTGAEDHRGVEGHQPDDPQRPRQVQLSPTCRAAVGPSLGDDGLHRAAGLA